jgi:hypothetical protein
MRILPAIPVTRPNTISGGSDLSQELYIDEVRLIFPYFAAQQASLTQPGREASAAHRNIHNEMVAVEDAGGACRREKSPGNRRNENSSDSADSGNPDSSSSSVSSCIGLSTLGVQSMRPDGVGVGLVDPDPPLLERNSIGNAQESFRRGGLDSVELLVLWLPPPSRDEDVAIHLPAFGGEGKAPAVRRNEKARCFQQAFPKFDRNEPSGAACS